MIMYENIIHDPYCMDMKIQCPANNDVLDEVMETLARDISFEGAPTQIR